MINRIYILNVLASLYLSLLCHSAAASCSQPYYTLTEVLANQKDAKHIFTCEVIATYIGDRGYTSIAVVQDRYRGMPVDTVYISSGGFTSQRGEKMPPKSRWLIISDTQDNLHYTAAVCENISRRTDTLNLECPTKKSRLGASYLEVLNQYFTLENENYSGTITLKGGDRVFAKGELQNGKSQDRWLHYSYWYDDVNRKLSSQVDYEQGRIEGYEINYDQREDSLIMESERYIKDGLIQYEKKGTYSVTNYTYSDEKTRTTEYLTFGFDGDTTSILTTLEPLYKADRTTIYYNHGRFSKTKGYAHREANGEGKYYKGARVGEWQLFTNDGVFDTTVIYSYPDTTKPGIISYDPKGQPQIEGQIVNGKRAGKWRHTYMVGFTAVQNV